MNIKERLINIEEEFNLYKSGIEKKHIYFIILYFCPPILAFLLLTKYYYELSEKIFIKIIIFVILLIGLIIHFSLKNTYYKTNKLYKDFINNKFNNLESIFSSKEEFRKSVIEAAKEIFLDKKIELSNITIKKSIFWNNVFIILGLEIEEQDYNKNFQV